MTCKDVREELSAWLDGEMGEAAQAGLKAHLEGCAACREELRLLTALEAALGNLAAPIPLETAEKVLARISPRRRPWWQSLALAASLVLGLVLGGTMARDFYPLPANTGATAEVAALEDFHDFPQGSLGTILASYQPEEGNGNGL